jgi:hypothetical protein
MIALAAEIESAAANGVRTEICARDCFLTRSVLNFLSVVPTEGVDCTATASGRHTVAGDEARTGAELGR